MKLTILLPLIMLSLSAGPGYTQISHGHGTHAMSDAPTLPGDDTFGAISEIVAMLRNDPATDWSQVSITALRDHLVDMDAVARGAQPEAEPIEGGVAFRIVGDSPAGTAAGRLVSAHAPILATEIGWRSEAVQERRALVWRVSSAQARDSAQIRALGFIGLLATGAHHPAHHLAIARGEDMHQDRGLSGDQSR